MIHDDLSNIDRHTYVSIFATWLGVTVDEARARAQKHGALYTDAAGIEKVDLKFIDKALGTHYIELGPFGAYVVPDWLKPKLNGHRLTGMH